MPSRAISCRNFTADEFVLCMTMGHKTDRPILQAIFERRFDSPRYLGVIGSQAKRKVLVRELTEAGIR